MGRSETVIEMQSYIHTKQVSVH